ncbi:cytochrome c [Flavobacteriaceae bacterium]|nr:cytochrome c [Flavobacteriaceae bacterium]MDC3354115.1 cytochrome c [Flavobacteriaceae bacterium]
MKVFIVVYLLTVSVFTTLLFQEKTKEDSIIAGQEIYQDFCVQCHLTSGEGVSGVFPPLKSSDYLLNNIEKSIAGLKYGLRGKIIVNDETYNGVMLNQGLEDEEIADVMNYILNEWGNNHDKQITTQQVTEIQKKVLE